MPNFDPDLIRKWLIYEPLTGVFRWRANGREAGTRRKDGYVSIVIRQKQVLAHRLAWFYTHGTWPQEIDHLNGLQGDNRLSNLRDVSHMENGSNRPFLNTNNSSGIDGVSYHKPRDKWRARFVRNGKLHHVGTFSTKGEAAAALQEAKNAQF